MKNNVFYALILSGIVMMTSLGCSTPRMYPGPRLPPEKVALLEVTSGVITVRTVDGNPMIGFAWTPAQEWVELLPGEHVLTVRYFKAIGNTYIRSKEDKTVTLQAEAGREYRVIANDFANQWSPQVQDITGWSWSKRKFSH